jgi:trehalose monomycolate/heme transporter
VSTYWSTGSPRLVSTDRNSTYAVLQLTWADDAARHTSYQAIQAELTPASLASSGVTAQVGGIVPMGGTCPGCFSSPRPARSTRPCRS